jgi:hypothetical protein
VGTVSDSAALQAAIAANEAFSKEHSRDRNARDKSREAGRVALLERPRRVAEPTLDAVRLARIKGEAPPPAAAAPPSDTAAAATGASDASAMNIDTLVQMPSAATTNPTAASILEHSSDASGTRAAAAAAAPSTTAAGVSSGTPPEAAEDAPPSHTPESQLRRRLIRFVEDHREAVNAMIRVEPQLLQPPSPLACLVRVTRGFTLISM